MKTERIVLALLLTVAVAGCKTEFDALLSGNDFDAKYRGAFEYFDKAKYTKAAQLFESLAFAYSGTEREDTVQYYWGLSNYMYGDYETAEANLTSFVTSFPQSPFTENAAFLRVDCLYGKTLRYELDQTPTNLAITAISEYLIEYPDTRHREECNAMLKDLGERLDRKAFENAKIYYTMEDYMAARVALRNVLKEDSDNIYREQILYYTAMASFRYADLSVESKQRDRYLSFVDDYLNFIGEYPESDYRKELDGLYKRAQRALGRFEATEEAAPETE